LTLCLGAFDDKDYKVICQHSEKLTAFRPPIRLSVPPT